MVGSRWFGEIRRATETFAFGVARVVARAPRTHRAAQVPELPAILRAIPPAKVAAMQRRLAEVKERYFLYPFSTALALVRLRAARLRNATAT